MLSDPGIDPLDPDGPPPTLLELATGVGMLQCLLHTEAGDLYAILGPAPETLGQLEDLLPVEPAHGVKACRECKCKLMQANEQPLPLTDAPWSGGGLPVCGKMLNLLRLQTCLAQAESPLLRPASPAAQTPMDVAVCCVCSGLNYLRLCCEATCA